MSQTMFYKLLIIYEINLMVIKDNKYNYFLFKKKLLIINIML